MLNSQLRTINLAVIMLDNFNHPAKINNKRNFASENNSKQVYN